MKLLATNQPDFWAAKTALRSMPLERLQSEWDEIMDFGIIDFAFSISEYPHFWDPKVPDLFLYHYGLVSVRALQKMPQEIRVLQSNPVRANLDTPYITVADLLKKLWQKYHQPEIKFEP